MFYSKHYFTYPKLIKKKIVSERIRQPVKEKENSSVNYLKIDLVPIIYEDSNKFCFFPSWQKEDVLP